MVNAVDLIKVSNGSYFALAQFNKSSFSSNTMNFKIGKMAEINLNKI